MGSDVAGTYYDGCYIACDAFSDRNGGVVIPYTGREMFNLPPKVLLCYEPTKKKNKKKDAKRDRLINLLVQKLEEYHIEYTTDLKEISTVQMSIVFIDRSFVRNSHRLLDLFVEERKRSSMLYAAVWYANRESHIVRNLMSGGNNCPDLGWGLFFFKKKRCILGEAVGRFIYYLAKLKVKDIGIAFSENWEHIEDRLGVFAQEVVNQLNPPALDFSAMHEKLKSQLTDLSFQLYDQVVQNPKGPSLIAVIQGCHDGCGQLKVISNLLWTLINLRSAKRFFFCIHLSMDQQKHIGGRQRSLFNHFRKELCRKYRLKKLYAPLMILNCFIVIDGFDDFLSEKEPDPAIMLAKFVKKIGRGSLVIATCREKTTAAIASLLTSEMPTQFHIEGTQCSTLGTIKRHLYFTIPNTRLNQLVLEPELTEPTYSFLRDDGMDTYIPGEYEKIEAEESESPRSSFIDESGCRVICV